MHSPARRQRLEEAVSLSPPLIADYLNVPDYTAAHARYLDDLGIATFFAGRPMRNNSCGKQSRTAADDRQPVPDVLAYAVWLAVMERSLGHVLMERGDWAEAPTSAILWSISSRRYGRTSPERRAPGFATAVRVLGGGIS